MAYDNLFIAIFEHEIEDEVARLIESVGVSYKVRHVQCSLQVS